MKSLFVCLTIVCIAGYLLENQERLTILSEMSRNNHVQIGNIGIQKTKGMENWLEIGLQGLRVKKPNSSSSSEQIAAWNEIMQNASDSTKEYHNK